MDQPIGQDQIERAERTARRLERRRQVNEGVREAKGWERPKSIAGRKPVVKPDDHYTFTDAQMAIAMNVLERKLSGGQ